MTKKINMLTEYRQEKIVDKNEMFTIEIPAWYLKDIMKLISDKYLYEWGNGRIVWNPILHKGERLETKKSLQWRWIYNFIKRQIKEEAYVNKTRDSL